MAARRWGAPQGREGNVGSPWQYWIDSRFAFAPRYIQGTLVWLQRYWITWPVDSSGNVIDMYRSLYPDDPGSGPR